MKTTRTLNEVNAMVEEARVTYMQAKYGEDRNTPAMEAISKLSKAELSMYWVARECPNTALESRKYMIESIIDAFDWEYQQRALRG